MCQKMKTLASRLYNNNIQLAVTISNIQQISVDSINRYHSFNINTFPAIILSNKKHSIIYDHNISKLIFL